MIHWSIIGMALAAWTSMAGGIVWGALLGLRFHREDWLSGYASFQRRLLRLGHIACFGLAFVVLFAAGTLLALGEHSLWVAAPLVVSLVTMPLVCALTALRPAFRHLFFVPVTACAGGIGGLLSILTAHASL